MVEEEGEGEEGNPDHVPWDSLVREMSRLLPVEVGQSSKEAVPPSRAARASESATGVVGSVGGGLRTERSKMAGRPD